MDTKGEVQHDFPVLLHGKILVEILGSGVTVLIPK